MTESKKGKPGFRALCASGVAMGALLCCTTTAMAQSNPTPVPSNQIDPTPSQGPPPPTPEAKQEASSLPRTFPSQPGVTGDWGGFRTKLSQDGFDFFGSFQTQTGSNVGGGVQRGTDSNYQVILGTNVDLEKIIGMPGATFIFAAAERWGQNASTLAGVKVILDGNYGEGEDFRLGNLSLKQNLLNGRIAYQIGYFPSAAEFDYSPLLCSFLNQGLCGHPNSLGADSNGFQNPPGAQLGGRVTFFPTRDTYIKTAVFEVNPGLFTTDYEGWRLGLKGATGAISLLELAWTPTHGILNLPGHYKIGAYYDNSTAPDIVNAKIQRAGRANGWVYGDQMIWAFDPSAKRGLYVFGNATDANSSNAQISTYYSAGFVANGPFAARPDDVLSIGWAKSDLNPRKLEAEVTAKPNFGYYSAEQYFDISYKFQITPWLFITPDVQYLEDPGTFTAQKFKNATVIGGATGVAF
ncbi:carbohydrate porin [Caulobacter sp. S45]|uniref:carbohydrate porin n=1 Tax=Caulobacter sp. S45 TaxID=1641861 RepID=UPI00131B2F79|nr:carbohydrate porin [Caulobacter sp. S45]